MRIALLTIVLALSGLSVSAPAQVGVRIDNRGVSACFGNACRTPVVTRAHPRPRRVGRRPARVRYEPVTERVWVDGYYNDVHVPARWGFRYDSCGRRIRYCISPARIERVWVPGRWVTKTRYVRVSSRRYCR